MSAEEIVIELWGTVPAPQGSKNPWGGEANKNTKPWREAVASAAVDAMREQEVGQLVGPLRVVALLYFPRPKGHQRADGTLKPNAPVFKESAPDLDKLERALGDAMSKVVFHDDARIAWWDVRKLYTDDDHPYPGVCIRVQELS